MAKSPDYLKDAGISPENIPENIKELRQGISDCAISSSCITCGKGKVFMAEDVRRDGLPHLSTTCSLLKEYYDKSIDFLKENTNV